MNVKVGDGNDKRMRMNKDKMATERKKKIKKDKRKENMNGEVRRKKKMIIARAIEVLGKNCQEQ